MDLEELTVRDRFAMAALNGLMGTVTMPDRLKETDIQILVARAYQIADAMLRTRKKKAMAPATPRMPTISGQKTMLGVTPAWTHTQEKKATKELPQNADDRPEWPDEPPELTRAALPAVEKSIPSNLATKTGAPDAPAAGEGSIPPDLQGDKTDSLSSALEQPREPSVRPPTSKPKRSRIKRFVFLLMVAALTSGGYAYRARLRPWAWHIGRDRTSAAVATTAARTMGVTATPIGSGVASTAAVEVGTQTSALPSDSAAAIIDPDAGMRVRPSPEEAGVSAGISNPAAHRPRPRVPKHRSAATVQSSADSAR